MRWWTRRIFALVATALTMVAGASAATGPGTTQAMADPLVCPAYDAGKVQNPLPLAPAGETPVGSTSGQFTVGGDGAARYSIPLQAVPGPGGMTPALSLDYSSRTGNGYVGVGFSLAGPTVISRCSKTIAEDGVTEGVRLDAADRFCLAGLRLVAVSGTYGADGTEYRTSPETFARVTSVRTSPGSLDDGPDHFEVRTKDGLIHTYGLSDNDVIGPRRVNWPITETRDRQGNRIKFVYGTIKAPSSDPSLPGNVVIARRLDEMHYGNFTALIDGVPSPDRKVKFSYDSRPDAFHGYALGEVRSVSTRLSKIEMHRLVGAPGHGGYVNARSYTLTYQNDGATGFSKLRSLQECGTSSSACLPATTFDWEPGAAGFEARKVQQISVVPLPPSSVIVSSLLVLDIDGNGMEDLAFPHDTASGSGGEVWQILPSSGGSPFIDHNVFTAPLEGLSGAGTEAFAIDYDLDGRTDILPRDTFANDNKAWRPLLSRGGGTTARFMAPVNTGFVGPVNQKDRFATFADLDGDGYQDTLEYHEQSVFGAPPKAWYYRLRTGEASAAILAPVPDPSAVDLDAFGEAQLIGQLDPVEFNNLFLFDLNGDGRSEVVFRHPVHFHETLRALNVPQPSHIGGDFDTGLPAWILNDGVQRVFADINGDGLLELVTNVGTPEQIVAHPGSPHPKVYVWLNKGRGFTSPQAAVGTNVQFDLQHAVVVDYNGDGRQDLLTPASTTLPITPATATHDMHLLRSTGFGFQVHQWIGMPFSVPVREVSPNNQQYEVHPAYFAAQGPRVIDADGDGQDDIISVERDTGIPSTPSQFVYYRHKRAGFPPDRLVGIHEGLNASPATLSIDYTPMTRPWVYERGAACDHRKQFNCAINPYYVVSQVRRDAGLNGDAAATTIVSEYAYKSSITHKISRAWLGFAEQRVRTAPSDGSQSPVTVRRFYSNTEAKRDPRLVEEWTYGTMPDGQRWLERYRQTWDHKDTVTAAGEILPYDYVALRETWSYQFPSSADLDSFTPAGLDVQGGEFSQPFLFRTVVHDQVINLDGHGNVTKRRSHFGPGAFQTIVETGYDLDLDAWLLARPKKVTTTQILAGCSVIAECMETRTTEILGYAPNASGEPTLLPQSIRHYHTDADPGQVTETAYGYDAYGNVTRTSTSGDVDGQGTTATRTSCVTYDPDGVFPHAVSNALGHTAYTLTDPLLGVPTIAVDVNGRRTDTQYDALGRPVKVRRPGGAEADTLYSTELFEGSVLARVEVSDATGRQTETVHDRLGRPIIERFKGFDGVKRIRTRAFGADGTLRREDSTPVREGSQPPAPVTFTYDDRGRKLTRTEPNESDPAQPYVRTWAYDKRTVTATDTRGHVTRREYDIAGHLGRTVEALGKPEQVVRDYAYGPFGRLKSSQVKDRPETASHYTWDHRGNLLTRTDPDRGLTTYQYNAFNEPILTHDANGRESRPTYDALGRVDLLRVSEVTPTSTKLLSLTDYTYDVEPETQDRELGRLTRVRREDYVSTTAEGDEQRTQVDYDYDDALGRLAAVTHTVPSDVTPGVTAPYVVRYDYDAFDRIQTIHYPKLPGQNVPVKVGYHYTAAPGNGQLRAIDVTEGAATEPLWTLASTDEANRPLVTTTGDGIGKLQLYDWRGALAFQYLQTGANYACVACQRAYTNYFYDGEGNLDRRVDLQQGATERFGYDALGRLTRMSMDSLDSPWETWDYDALGNLTANTYRGAYHYDDPARPTRVTSVTGGTLGTTRTYGYDAVGNQVSRPGGTVVYNELNLPARLLGPAGERTAEFLYGAGGGRVRKTSEASGVTTYIGGVYEQSRRGTTVEHRLIVPGVAVMPYKEVSGVLTKQPTLFLHTDHLGSIAAVTGDEDAGPGVKAVVKESRSYDAFGLKRNPDWLSDSYADIPAALTTQGYTGHNDDPELGLIDMKGRVYDPTLARFLTPDPFVSDPSATQPWNPYAYVRNNPLRYTDPSGFEECAGCEEFWNAGEAFWEGGTGGLNAYSHGALDREVERFVNKYYDVRRDSGLWGDARKAEADARKAQLKQYDEQRIRRSGDVEPPEALAAPEVPTLTMPGLDSGLSPGVDPKIQAICEAQPWACAADEVTVKGHNPGSVTASWEYDHPEWVREIDAAVQGFCRFISSLSCQDWAGDTPMPFSIGGPAEGVRSGIPLLTRATPRIEISEAVASKIASRLGVQAWEAKLLVKAISTGHAFRKHAAEFGVATEDQLAQKVSNAMANGRMQKLASDRVGFAGHDGTAVILNPHGADAGTAVYRGTAQRAWDFIRGK